MLRGGSSIFNFARLLKPICSVKMKASIFLIIWHNIKGAKKETVLNYHTTALFVGNILVLLHVHTYDSLKNLEANSRIMVNRYSFSQNF